MTELSVSSAQLLSGIAILLLVFVSGGVMYLSTVEWRDRRRRKAAGSPQAKATGAKAPGSKRSAFKGASNGSAAKGTSAKGPFAKPGHS